MTESMMTPVLALAGWTLVMWLWMYASFKFYLQIQIWPLPPC